MYHFISFNNLLKAILFIRHIQFYESFVYHFVFNIVYWCKYVCYFAQLVKAAWCSINYYQDTLICVLKHWNIQTHCWQYIALRLNNNYPDFLHSLIVLRSIFNDGQYQWSLSYTSGIINYYFIWLFDIRVNNKLQEIRAVYNTIHLWHENLKFKTYIMITLYHVL